MADMFFDQSVHLHRIPVTLEGATRWQFVRKGGITGVAIQEADEDLDNRTVVQVHGHLQGAPAVAAGGAAIEEGAYLVWDGTLLDGAGAYTNTGATQTNFDVIAGYQAAVAAGEDGEIPIWVGILPYRPTS